MGGEDYRENKNRRGGHLSASHNCPVYEDALGCKPEALCVERQVKSAVNGTIEYCPSSSVCPKKCPAGEKLCRYDDNGDDGCRHEDICQPIGRDSQGALGVMDWRPPLCSGN